MKAAVSNFTSGYKSVYTTMRTVGERQKIFDLKAHIARIAALPSAVVPGHGSFDVQETEKLVIPEIRKAVETCQGNDELRITVAARPKGHKHEDNVDQLKLGEVEFVAFAEPMQSLDLGNVFAEFVVAEGRENPNVKHGDWIEQRKKFEAEMRKECNEAIMVDSKGRISEGLSSNVVIIENGTIITAPEEAVLAGTVLKLILDICEKDKLTVRREFPSLDLVSKGNVSVMVTSTSRLALPVNWLYLPDGKKISVPVSKEAEILRKKVLDSIENASYKY